MTDPLQCRDKAFTSDKLSFEPRYHALRESPTGNYWAATQDPRFPDVRQERARIEAEGVVVNSDAQAQLNRFRDVSSIPFLLLLIWVIATALDVAWEWSWEWQVVAGVVTLGVVLGICWLCSYYLSKSIPRE